MVVSAHLLFKLPIAKDRVRFLRLYSGVSLLMGLGIGYAAHRPVYEPTPSKPSIMYKLHLKRLLWMKKISQEDYEKYMGLKKG